MNSPRLLITGYAEHGKDTSCRIIENLFGITSISSSYFALDTVVYPILRDRYGYSSKEECYKDRYNKRQDWYDLIKAHNTPDGCRLARNLYSKYNIYNGIRNIEEFLAIKKAKLFDYSIWIDASERKPKESLSSCTVSPQDMDIIISNNGPISQTAGALVSTICKLYPNIEHSLLTIPKGTRHGK